MLLLNKGKASLMVEGTKGAIVLKPSCRAEVKLSVAKKLLKMYPEKLEALTQESPVKKEKKEKKAEK